MGGVVDRLDTLGGKPSKDVTGDFTPALVDDREVSAIGLRSVAAVEPSYII